MKKDTILIAVLAVSLVAVVVVVISDSSKRDEEIKKTLYVMRKSLAKQMAEEAAAQKAEKDRNAVLDFVTPRSDGVRRDIVPWTQIIDVHDQFGGGYRNIGTVTSQAEGNNSVFILLAKPADSRHQRFWLRIQSAEQISNRFVDVYLPTKTERIYTGHTITAGDLPENSGLEDDMPLVASVTETWYLYG